MLKKPISPKCPFAPKLKVRKLNQNNQNNQEHEDRFKIEPLSPNKSILKVLPLSNKINVNIKKLMFI